MGLYLQQLSSHGLQLPLRFDALQAPFPKISLQRLLTDPPFQSRDPVRVWLSLASAAALRTRRREIAAGRLRFGHRRVHQMPRREQENGTGKWVLNHKRV